MYVLAGSLQTILRQSKSREKNTEDKMRPKIPLDSSAEVCERDVGTAEVATCASIQFAVNMSNGGVFGVGDCI
jgi:hypothetical protein